MTVLRVVRDMCMQVGVTPPSSLFAASIQERTRQELLALANECAQTIAYDTREWRALKTVFTATGNGVQTAFDLPVNYRRMLLTANVRRASSPRQPLRFISDSDEWLERRLGGTIDAWGEWTLLGDQIQIFPALAAGEQASFVYLDKNCVAMAGGNFGDVFINDADTFRLPERLLMLCMVWRWKENKGSPYAEALSTYSDALFVAAGADKPSPILVGRQPISAAVQVAYPWPVPT